MKYFLFLDESGDHGLSRPSIDFPVFLLCGVLVSAGHYEKIRRSMNELKESIWLDKQVIFHSRDIRKCEKEFQVLFNLDLKRKFYEEINQIVAGSDYLVLASAIQKNAYIEKFGRLQDDVYEVALSFVIEQALTILNRMDSVATLSLVIERRGHKEDKQSYDHFQRLCAHGIGILTTEQVYQVAPTLTFRSKKENINGLQLADLVAYPIARYVIEPDRANPAYEVLKSKIYQPEDQLKGLKIYP